MLENPPQVLNLSLTGPYDPLLERLIQKAVNAGVVVVAAGSTGNPAQSGFPSSMHNVIGVRATPAEGSPVGDSTLKLFAPGNRILVAVPTNRYDFRSGSSLAAAHVSGVVALILAVAPGHTQDTISRILQRSQVRNSSSVVSINACTALNLASAAQHCGD
jgi:subtilisin family serine protease